MAVSLQAEAVSIFTDNFDDSGGISILEHNHEWTLDSGNAIIQNNALLFEESSYISLPQFIAPDQCVSYDALFPLTSGIIELDVRYNVDGSNYHAYIHATESNFRLRKYTPHAGLHQFSEINGLNPSSGLHNFKLCAIGSEITAYLDGEVLAAVTDTQITEGYPLFAASAGNVIDNFIFESFDSIPTTTPTPSPIVPPTATPTILPPTATPSPTKKPTLTPTPTTVQPSPTPKPTHGKVKVKIVLPRDGMKIHANTNFTLVASVQSQKKIKTVEFQVNNKKICTEKHSFFSIYSCNWKLPKAKGVSYNVTVKAYDTTGNTHSDMIRIKSR